MFKLIRYEIGLLKKPFIFYIVIFSCLYIILSVILTFSVSALQYIDLYIFESTQNISLDINIANPDKFDESIVDGGVINMDRKYIYDGPLINNILIINGKKEYTANGMYSSFRYGIKGVSNGKMQDFRLVGDIPHSDSGFNSNNKNSIWLSDFAAKKLSANVGNIIKMIPNSSDNTYIFEVKGIFSSIKCTSDYLLTYDSFSEMMHKEKLSLKYEINLKMKNYEECRKMILKLNQLDCSHSCPIYDYIENEVNGIKLICNIFFCISAVIAAASAFTSASMSQVIIINRRSSIAMYKILGMKNHVIKIVYFVIIETVVFVSFLISIIPSQKFSNIVNENYIALSGFNDFKSCSDFGVSILIYIVCAVFSFAGAIKLFLYTDNLYELDFLRDSK